MQVGVQRGFDAERREPGGLGVVGQGRVFQPQRQLPEGALRAQLVHVGAGRRVGHQRDGRALEAQARQRHSRGHVGVLGVEVEARVAPVDVELRRRLWKLFTDLKRQGKTVILTTHYIEEADYRMPFEVIMFENYTTIP